VENRGQKKINTTNQKQENKYSVIAEEFLPFLVQVYGHELYVRRHIAKMMMVNKQR